MDLQFELRNSALPLAAYVIEKPPAGTDAEIKSMSNFLTRKVPGKFWCLRSDERQIVISNRSFPGAIRLQTKTIIDPLVVDILTEQWSFPYRKRITRSHGQFKPAKPGSLKGDNPILAQWIGANGEQARRTFVSLSIHEKVAFLHENLDHVILTPRGSELIETYRKTNHCGLRPADGRGADKQAGRG